MPIIIKRYANRKLYDTDKKKYITLSGIARYIHENEEVIVYDNTTGDDISNLILTQIIIERERENSGLFPKSILAGLIKASGDTFEVLKKYLTSPIDLVIQVNDEIDRRLDHIIEEGKITPEEGIYLRENLISFGRQKTRPDVSIESIIEHVLKNRGVPSGDEFHQMIEEIQRLSEIIDQTVD